MAATIMFSEQLKAEGGDIEGITMDELPTFTYLNPDTGNQEDGWTQICDDTGDIVFVAKPTGLPIMLESGGEA